MIFDTALKESVTVEDKEQEIVEPTLEDFLPPGVTACMFCTSAEREDVLLLCDRSVSTATISWHVLYIYVCASSGNVSA